MDPKSAKHRFGVSTQCVWRLCEFLEFFEISSCQTAILDLAGIGLREWEITTPCTPPSFGGLKKHEKKGQNGSKNH